MKIDLNDWLVGRLSYTSNSRKDFIFMFRLIFFSKYNVIHRMYSHGNLAASVVQLTFLQQ